MAKSGDLLIKLAAAALLMLITASTAFGLIHETSPRCGGEFIIGSQASECSCTVSCE